MDIFCSPAKYPMVKIFVVVLVLFVMLLDWNSALALEFPKIGSTNLFGAFPSINPFPFPSKTPKPSGSPTSTSTPAPTATPTTVFEILDADPSLANYMEEFTISGTNLGSPGSVNFRYYSQNFTSAAAPIVFWNNNQIKAKVPALKKGSYRIQVVRNDGKKSNELRFSITNGQPVINSSSVSAVNGKYELTFQGTEFGKRGSIDIYKGTSLVGTGVIKYWSTSKVRFELPALSKAQYGFQIVTADGRRSSFMFFTVGN